MVVPAGHGDFSYPAGLLWKCPDRPEMYRNTALFHDCTVCPTMSETFHVQR